MEIIENCKDNIAILNSHVANDHASAELLNPIAEHFQIVVKQLKQIDVDPNGKTDGEEPDSHSYPPPPFAPLKMAEKCEEHIAAIKGYRVDHSDSAVFLDPIVAHFEFIVDKLDRKHVQLMSKMEVAEIPDTIKRVSEDAAAFEKELLDHKSTIVREDEKNYDRVLRAKKFVEGDQVLSRCLRKLKYVLAEVQTNPTVIKSKAKLKVP